VVSEQEQVLTRFLGGLRSESIQVGLATGEKEIGRLVDFDDEAIIVEPEKNKPETAFLLHAVVYVRSL